MNLGIESETLEFKKSTGEIEKAVNNIASMLNKHGHGVQRHTDVVANAKLFSVRTSAT